MHPFYFWWRNHVQGGGEECGAEAGCGPGGGGGWGRHGHGPWGHHFGGHGEGPGFGGFGGFGGGPFGGGPFGGGPFGVRRPLRFLAWKLDLSEPQVAELAKIVDELKTERAQAEVDGRRAVASLADAVAGDAFDQAKAADGGAQRVRTAERLRDAVATALSRIHAVLEPEQRKRLAYLIRTGTISI